MASRNARRLIAGSVMVLSVGWSGSARAQADGDEQTHAAIRPVTSADLVHVRAADPVVATLVTAGAAQSKTIRRLLDQLDESDVVAYVRFDPTLPARLTGHTWFVAATAHIRYVEMVVRPAGNATETLAAIAHELAHAVEVAMDPAIVDPKSMAARFFAIGRLGIRSTGMVVETSYAVGVGADVARELAPHRTELAAALR